MLPRFRTRAMESFPYAAFGSEDLWRKSTGIKKQRKDSLMQRLVCRDEVLEFHRKVSVASSFAGNQTSSELFFCAESRGEAGEKQVETHTMRGFSLAWQ